MRLSRGMPSTLSQWHSSALPPKKFRRRPAARSIRQAPALQALLASRPADTVRLPLDFYRLLNVPPTISRESTSRAYERALEHPPDWGYSAQALAARAVVLRSAMETIVNPSARRQYDERLRVNDVVEEVPPEYLAGTLIALQEAGEAATVVAAGEAWLAAHRRDRGAADVATATALARCDLGRAALEANGSVEQAVAQLELGAALLRQYGGGTPALEAHIEAAVADLHPALALELVALPLADAARRARGLALLPSVLLGFVESSPAAASRRGALTRKQLLERLRESLTAAEHVALARSAGAAYASTPAELYEAAMAHIAHGCAAADPSLVRSAAELLERAEAGAAALAAAAAEPPDGRMLLVRDRRVLDERHRRAVAACVCALLLGSTEGAVAALGLRGAQQQPKCDRQVLAFVRANSPDKDDVLPGLCALVQRWVSDVALVTFRPETSTPPAFSLNAWFEERAVKRHLSGQPSGGGGGAVGFALRGVAALLAWPFRAARALMHAPREAGRDAEAAAAAAAAAAGAGAAPRATGQAPADGRSAAASAAEADATSTMLAEAAPAAAAESTRQPRREGAAPAEAAVAEAAEEAPPSALPPSFPAAAGRDEEDDGEFEFPSVPVALEAIRPLDGVAEDEWMRSAYAPRRLRWGRLVGTAALLAGGAVLLARAALPVRAPPQPAQTTAPIAVTAAPAPEPADAAAAATPAATPAAAVVPLPSRSEVAAVVARWQRIKADALGPSHAAGKLSSALRGELLDQWRQRSEQLRQRGWHYAHDLKSCRVTGVTRGGAPGAALVAAQLREGVTIHRGADGPPQSFVSEYAVVYEMQKERGAGWVITAAQVQAT